MSLRDVLLHQPDFIRETPVTNLPWLEPPFATSSDQNTLDTPCDQRTPGEVADLLKTRFRLALSTSKKLNEMRWVTTCLTSEPTEETTPKYSDCEACASVYVAVNILIHHDGIRHLGLKSHSSLTTRGLLVLIACRLQQLMQNPPPGYPVDMGALSDIA